MYPEHFCRLNLPAEAGDDPELIEHPVYHRPVPRDVPAFVEARAPGICPECVVFVWPDGAGVIWDATAGWSTPRVPPAPPKLPATIEEAEAAYRIERACGVPEAEARAELQAHVERIRAKLAERQEAQDKPAGDDAVDGLPAWLSPRALAERFRVPFDEAFRKRLERWRKAHATDEGAGYVENQDALPNQPKYLYNVQAVMPLIRELQSRAKRPANVRRHDR